MNRSQIARKLEKNAELVKALGISRADGRIPWRKQRKLQEIAGFAEYILKVIDEWYSDRAIRILECSCGKSYLCLALYHLLREKGRAHEDEWIGVDTSENVIESSIKAAAEIGARNVRFVRSRTIDLDLEGNVDLTLALHACDTATDEAIAKGILLKSGHIMVVPCCQNQIRGQLGENQPLRSLTQFGALAYNFANLLTDGLRALFLRGAGYEVQISEMAPLTVTPKNLLITARKVKNPKPGRMKEYIETRTMFGVRPAIEKLLPDLVEQFAREQKPVSQSETGVEG